MPTSVYYFPLTGTLLEDIRSWLLVCNKDGIAVGSKVVWERAAAKVAQGLLTSNVKLTDIDDIKSTG